MEKMSKSKKERQQEKKELRQAQEKAQPKQPQAEKKPEPKPVEAKNAQRIAASTPPVCAQHAKAARAIQPRAVHPIR